MEHINPVEASSDNMAQQFGEEEGQLTLFGFGAITSTEKNEKKESSNSCGDSVGKQTSTLKKQGKGGTKSNQATSQTLKEPELEFIKLGESWKIHYAASVFEVDVLFINHLNNGVETVTLEEIRLKLVYEVDAAELTPSGTKWRYDVDNRQLFPEAWGLDKGAY